MKKKQIITTIIILLITITGCTQKVYDIMIEIAPEGSGEVVGEGTYEAGEEAELAAIPNEGYKFSNWTLEGEELSRDQILEINIEEEYNFVANFEKKEEKEHTIKLNEIVEENTISSNEEIDKDINEKIKKIDKLVGNKDWVEIGEILEDIIKNGNFEKFSRKTNIAIEYLAIEPSKIKENFKTETLITKEKLEQINWEKIKPEKPILDILERDSKEIYQWVCEYERFIAKFYKMKFSKLEQEKNIMTEDAKEFLINLSSQYSNSKNINLGYKTISLDKNKLYYFSNMGGPSIYITDEEAEEIEVKVTEEKIIFKIKDYLYKSKTIVDEAQEYSTIEVNYIKKGDGTFRVENISLIQ